MFSTFNQNVIFQIFNLLYKIISLDNTSFDKVIVCVNSLIIAIGFQRVALIESIQKSTKGKIATENDKKNSMTTISLMFSVVGL